MRPVSDSAEFFESAVEPVLPWLPQLCVVALSIAVAIFVLKAAWAVLIYFVGDVSFRDAGVDWRDRDYDGDHYYKYGGR